ncbi:sensor histidine kinase [Pseudomonas defluvii]|uniref:sensor histidine kinase n=1 Tax=Pseudomonas defluvii TaxID=1876757 RepID=UPI0008117F9D|nr:ATP-binding protein [Pseudomonas defluvii]
MIKRTLVDEKPFEFSARVTLQLGRESISSSTVALSELIKNSYDADADHVTLDFHLRENSVSTLIIDDNGSGMDPETLLGHWLKIGTDNKSVVERSAGKCRVLTGAKGLGRLGIDRLCKKLVLYSKTKEMTKAIQLNIDWKRFEKTNKSLSEIKHPIYEVDLPITDKYGSVFSNPDSSGTRMVLIGLKDEWDQNFLDILENELRLLTSPFQAENEFSIRLKIRKGESQVDKSLNSEKFLSAARWKVKATVDSNGNVEACYTNNQQKLDILQEPIAWSSWLKNSGSAPLFGPVKFEFYYLAQDTENLSKLNLKVRNFREFMRLNQGVRLYRDHFRVRPYGEPSGKGDWLDIGLRKVSSPGGLSQLGWKIGPNQIVGSVLISRETNAILNDQANREGIVENSAFFQLRTFLLKVIETFETLVQKDASSDGKLDLSTELARILSKSNEDVENAIEDLKKTVSSISRKKKNKKKSLSPSQLVAQRLSHLEALRHKQSQAEQEYLDALRAEKKELEEQKNTLSNLASIGILTISFGHEVRQHSGFALNGSTRALAYLEKLDNSDGLLDDPIDCIQIAKDGAKYVDNFSRFAIENIKPDKRTRKKVHIPGVFKYVFEIFSVTLDKMGVSSEINIHTDGAAYEVYAFEIDWESIVINFMTNSIWAIEAQKQRQKSTIRVDLYETDGEITVIYSDSGIGLEAGTEESIFIPMNSGKRDGRGNVIGTGMGLSIVKTHVEDHMLGSISAKAHSDLGGAEFTIKVPVRGKNK